MLSTTQPAIFAPSQDGTAHTLGRRQRLELLRAQLDTERQSFTAHWRDLNDYILPRRGRFTTSDTNRGDRRSKKIIDSTASFAARTLASGMMSGVTSPARPWFRLTTPDPDLAESQAVKAWLHVVTQRMSSVFIRSNLYNALPIVYGDMGTFGTASLHVAEDDKNVIRCYPHPIGSYALANDANLRIRVFMREFKLTVRQIVEMFGDGTVAEKTDRGLERISRTTRELWRTGQTEQLIEVMHTIMPNADQNPNKLEAKFKPYVSLYCERGAMDQGLFLRESGFDDFPVLAPRWETTGEDVYGTNCPGMVALGDIMQLQLGERRSMQAIEKMVNPPMVGPTSMRNSKSTILPGDITYVDAREGQQGFRAAHEVNFRIQELEMKQEQVRYRVRRAYYEDLFLMLAQSPAMQSRDITAREIDERHEEKLLALGPVLEQLNQDLLDPLIDRTFNIMERQGLLPEPPEEMQGEPLRVEYISIMAQAQRMVGLSGLERFSAFVGTLVETNPSILDKIDQDQMVDEYAAMTGVPPRVVVPDDEVKKIRVARDEQAAAAAQAEQLKTMGQGAQALANADTSGQNALTDLLAAQGGGMPQSGSGIVPQGGIA